MARLKLSVGTHTRGERPMMPAEAALALKEFTEETHETVEGVARRLGVHPDTCRLFLSILDLPSDWREIWHFGKADGTGRLPFSMAGRLASGFRNGTLSKDDLDLLKGAVLDPDNPARREDITNILSCRYKNPDKPLEECIREIMNLTPRRIQSYVIITDIDLGTASLPRDDADGTEGSIMSTLAQHLPGGSVEDLRICDGRHLQICLTKEGYDGFYRLAGRLGLAPKDLANHLCSRGTEEAVAGG